MDTETTAVFELQPFVWCPKCGASLTFEPRGLDSYFSGAATTCGHCRTLFDPWVQFIDVVEKAFSFSLLALAGARQMIVRTTLASGEYREIDLTTLGIPGDAEIIDLNLTSMGSALPLLAHGNTPFLDPFPPFLHLFGRATPIGQPGGQLNIFVTWFVRSAEDTRVRHLVEAARHLKAKRFDAAVIPSNTAAEAAISPVVREVLLRFGARDHVENMLEKGATYSHQLNVLLPVVAHLANVPPLPAHVRGVLNRLRSARNKFLHTGRCPPQTARTASEHFVAALFATEYARYLREAATRSGMQASSS